MTVVGAVDHLQCARSQFRLDDGALQQADTHAGFNKIEIQAGVVGGDAAGQQRGGAAAAVGQQGHLIA